VLVGTVEATLLILLLVIVFGPIISERFGIPGIVGLIAGGIVFGPYAVGWLRQGGLVTELGAIGILYLMFLAGLGFNMRGFLDNRSSAIVYGLLGFVLPFFLSIFVAMSFSDIGVLGAALIGAMWASNTLLAYPEVKAAGLEANRAVGAAVSAGVVADLLSLSVLAIVTSTAVIDYELQPEATATVQDPTLPLWIAVPILLGFTLWVLPKVTEWFFVKVGRTRMQRFVFALAGMAAGATVALVGGIEGLIGAFLAGLGMNRLVPAQGALMERLDFVGSAIFIPAFIVSIGLNIDPAVLFDLDTLVLGLVFTGLVVVGKTSAALITGWLFHYSADEIGVMATLSFGQAASTLAIAQVGLTLGMFDQQVVNAAVLAIVATALITSYGTRYFASRVPRPPEVRAPLGQAILVDVRRLGSDPAALMSFAGSIARADDGLVVPYAVAASGESAEAKALVQGVVEAASEHGLDTEGVTRIDDSFSSGTLHLAEENAASLVLLAWDGPRFTSDYLVGNDVDRIGQGAPVPTVAGRILRPWDRIVVATGTLQTAWKREDAELAFALVRRLRSRSEVPVLVVTPDRGFAEERVGDPDGVDYVVEADARHAMIGGLTPSDLVVVPAHVLHDLPPAASWRVAREARDVSLAIVAGPHRLSISRGVGSRPTSLVNSGL
jgi:Kef-type K+ transport system membrane component KefB